MNPLLFALLAMTSPDRPANVCGAVQVPMPATGSPELSRAAEHVLDRFLRGSPLEMEWPRHALADPVVIFLIVAPYGDMRGYTQNQRLTRARGEAIRLHMLRYQDRWNFRPGQLHIVDLPDTRLFLDSVGIRPDRENRHDAYVLIQYPRGRLPAAAADTSPSYCGDVFSR